MRFVVSIMVWAYTWCGLGGSHLLCDDQGVQIASGGEIAALVEQLGASRFATRQAASDRLVKLGPTAAGPLREALKHDDPEIRRRSKRILAEIKDRQYAAKLEALLAGNTDVSFPCWKEYENVVGSALPARKLFAEMYYAEPELFQAYDYSMEQASRALSECLAFRGAEKELFEAVDADFPGMVSPPQCSLAADAATLLIRANIEWPGVGGRFGFPETLWTLRIRDSNSALVLKLCLYYATHPASNDFTTYSGHLSSLRTGLMFRNPRDPKVRQELEKAAAALAATVLEKSIVKWRDGWGEKEGQVLTTLAEYGDRSHIKVVTPLLNIQHAFRTQRSSSPAPLQVRDLALWTLLHLSDQDCADYGFSSLQIMGKRGRFPNESQRKQALAKWKIWANAHLID